MPHPLLPLSVLALTLTLTLTLGAGCGDKGDDSGSEEAHGHDHDAHSDGETLAAYTDGGTWRVVVEVPGGSIPMSEEFDLTFMVHDAEDESAMATEAEITVTADMPDHGHGMNQEPVVTAHGDGTFTASGMLFHMEGAWDIPVTVTDAGASELARLTLNCCD